MIVDRALARRIAGLASGTEPPAPYVPAGLAETCADAERRITAYTGLRAAAPLPAPEAVGRRPWIAANVEAMADLVDPVAERAGGSGPLAGALRATTGVALSAEAGALTGYLSQRVLGQYELALTDAGRAPRLLFVAPNIAEATRRLSADRDELWTWIAVHEVTHAVQFAAVPWLREHVAGLLAELLESLDVELDPAALLRPPSRQDLRALSDAVRRLGLAGALAGPQRRVLLERMQTTMAVVEGHAEHVMDVVGADVVGSLDALRRSLDRRRASRPPALRLLERLIGLEAKMRQYEDGKRFCDAVAAEAGVAALHAMFAAPDALPTTAELAEPGAWMRRRLPGAAA